ncbi:MAG: hypothetical protein Q9160_007885 [Pyrenula sp. 1 TL-2023]
MEGIQTDPSNSKLCTLCYNFVRDYLCSQRGKPLNELIEKDRWYLERWGVDIRYKHRQVSELEDASTYSGCDLCCLVFKNFDPKALSSSHHVEFRILNRHGLFRLDHFEAETVKAFTKPEFEFCWRQPWHHRLRDYSYNAAIDRKLGRIPERSSDADGCLDLLRGWLRECLSSHENSTSPSRILPTRLIDVGSRGVHQQPKIVELNGARPNVLRADTFQGQYITLSHCWGGEIAFKTTKSNLEARKEQIPLENIPKTFRDAIDICRALDVRYLWIDALCIIQDSGEDWRKESSLMSTVYSGSLLTLSALDSKDSLAGIFKDRPYRNQICVPLAISNAFFTRMERVLSPRVVHFSEEQLFWECSDDHFSEDGYASMAKKGTEFRTDVFLKTWSQIPWSSPGYVSRIAYGWWYELIEDYSRRDLSIESDKLPAILGLAKQCNEYKAGGYVLGLWKSDLNRGLLLQNSPSLSRRSGRYELPSRVKGWRAPSWSWAAIEGAIRFRYTLVAPEEFLAQTTILDVEYGVRSTGNKLGRYGADGMSTEKTSAPKLLVRALVARSRFAPEQGGELRISNDMSTFRSKLTLTDCDLMINLWFCPDNGFLAGCDYQCVLFHTAKFFEKFEVNFLVVTETKNGESERLGLASCFLSPSEREQLEASGVLVEKEITLI